MNAFNRWLRRWRHLWSRKDAERDLDEEMRFHLEMEARDLVESGVDAREARRRARVGFGGEDRHKEAVRDVRGLRWWDDVRTDVRVALRGLRRHRGFSAVVIAILALGIGANTAVFGIVDRLLLRSLPYPGGHDLVQLWQGTPGGRQWVSAPDAQDWANRLQTFAAVSAFTPERFNIAGALGAETVTAAAVDGAFFEVMDVAPARGRVLTAVEAMPGSADVLILSDALWRRRFGADPAIVGATVSLEGRAATVIGVMPPDFAFPEGAEMWTPLRLFDQDWHARRGIDWLQVIARKRSDASEASIASDLARTASQLAVAYPETNADDRIEAVSLRDELYGDLRLPALVLMAAVSFVLLMSCASVAGLLLARATARGPETALRLALGSGRGRLIRAWLTESIVIAIVGGTAGLVAASLIGRLLLELAPVAAPTAAGPILDARILGFAATVTMLTILLFGLAPALLGIRSSLRWAMRGNASDSGRGAIVRHILVTGQIAIAVVLVIGGLLFTRSLDRLLSQETGFDVENVATARIALTETNYPDDADRITFYDGLVSRISAMPGIESVAIANNLPLSGGGITFSFEVEDAPPVAERDAPLAGLRVVSPDYFRTMRIPILAGRDFDARESIDSNLSAIVDSSLAARHLQGRDPIGTRINSAGEWRTIIGVVGGVRHTRLEAASAPAVYLPVTQRTAGSAFIIARGIRAAPEPSIIADAVRAIDPEQPVFAIRPLRDYLLASAARPRFLAVVIGAFAIASLLIAALGVYGIVAFTVARRAREFGIRLAVGARPASIIRHALRHGLLLLAFGLPLGLLAAFALTRLIEGLLFGVSAGDPATFIAVPLVLAAVIISASWLPSRRAARVDPMQVLRPE